MGHTRSSRWGSWKRVQAKRLLNGTVRHGVVEAEMGHSIIASS